MRQCLLYDVVIRILRRRRCAARRIRWREHALICSYHDMLTVALRRRRIRYKVFIHRDGSGWAIYRQTRLTGRDLGLSSLSWLHALTCWCAPWSRKHLKTSCQWLLEVCVCLWVYECVCVWVCVCECVCMCLWVRVCVCVCVWVCVCVCVWVYVCVSCLSLSVKCYKHKDLWMYVSHVYLSPCKLTSQSIWIPFLLLVLWIQIKEENVCVCVCV